MLKNVENWGLQVGKREIEQKTSFQEPLKIANFGHPVLSQEVELRLRSTTVLYPLTWTTNHEKISRIGQHLFSMSVFVKFWSNGRWTHSYGTRLLESSACVAWNVYSNIAFEQNQLSWVESAKTLITLSEATVAQPHANCLANVVPAVGRPNVFFSFSVFVAARTEDQVLKW